jgi:predicted RNA-binding Zn ribbon-like protein
VLPVNVRELERIGGAVCLDFVNTVDPRYVSDRIEYVPDYDALLKWSVGAGLLDPSDADRLGDIARHRPQLAGAVHRRALALREALFELLRREPGPDRAASLATLNAELARSRTQQVVERALGGFESAWPASTALDRVLWPIASSAADLLTSPRFGRVRECAGERCGWLFLDTSKAGRRRWCSMADCGNRAKAKRRRTTREASGA